MSFKYEPRPETLRKEAADFLMERFKLLTRGEAVQIKSFRKSQFPHKSVNLSFLITDTKNKLTDLCGS